MSGRLVGGDAFWKGVHRFSEDADLAEYRRYRHVGMLAFQGRPAVVDLGDRCLKVGQAASGGSGHKAMTCPRADSDTPFLSSPS